MASENDFYIKFGSNAGQWARGLDKELEPAHAALQKLRRAMVDQLGGVQRAAPSGSGGGNATNTASANRELERLSRNLQNYDEDLSHTLQGIANIVRAMERAAGKIDAAASFQARSQGSQQAERRRLKDAATGRYTSRDTPGAVPAASLRQVPLTSQTRDAAGRTSPPVTIAGTPKVIIEDASLDRLVQRVGENVKATRDVEAAVNRLGEHLEATANARPVAQQGDVTEPAAPRERRRKGKLVEDNRSVEQVRADRGTEIERLNSRIAEAQSSVAALQALRPTLDAGLAGAKLAGNQKVFDDLSAQAAKMDKDIERNQKAIADWTVQIEKLSKPTNRERSEANRAEARAQREGPGSLSAVERANTAARLTLGGGSAEQLGQLARRELEQIASAFTQEGFPTRVTSKMRKPEIIAEIQKSFQAFQEAGEVTIHDLTTSKVPDKIGDATRKLIARMLKQMDSAEESINEAWDTLRLNAQTGGAVPGRQVPLAAMVARRVMPPNQGTGAAFGGPRNVLVTNARDVIRNQADELRLRAIDTVIRRVTNANAINGGANFDPRSAAFTVEGQGPDARKARQALRAIKEVTDAFDKIAQEYFDLEKALNNAEDFIERASARLESGQLKGSAATREVQRIEEAQARAADLRERMLPFDPALTDAAVRRGVALRQQARDAREAQRFDPQAQAAFEATRNRMLASRDFREGTLMQLFGTRTQLGSGGALNKLLPFVGTNGRNISFTGPDSNAPDPDVWLKFQKTVGRYIRALKRVSDARQSEDPELNNPERIAELVTEAEARLSRILTSYEKMTGVPLAGKIDTGKVDAAGESIFTFSDAAQALAVEQSRAEARRAAQRRRQAEARQRAIGANLTDVRSVLPNLQDFATASIVDPLLLQPREKMTPEQIVTRDQQEIAAARAKLAETGVQWNETVNATLNEATTVKDLIERVTALLQSGELMLSQFNPNAARRGGRGIIRQVTESGEALDVRRAGETQFSDVRMMRVEDILARAKDQMNLQTASMLVSSERDARTSNIRQAMSSGQLQPLTLDMQGELRDGYHRLISAMLADIDELPVRQVVSEAGQGNGQDIFRSTMMQGFTAEERSPLKVIGTYQEVISKLGRMASNMDPELLRRATSFAAGELNLNPMQAGAMNKRLADQAGIGDYRTFRDQSGLKGAELTREMLRQINGTGTVSLDKAATDLEQAAQAIKERGAMGAGDQCCERIVAAINSVNDTLRTGVRISGKAPETETRTAQSPDAETAANAPTGRAGRLQREKSRDFEFASQAGRQQFFGSLPNDLQQIVRGEDQVAAAAELVRRRFLTQRQAVGLFRAELHQTNEESKNFSRALRSSVADQELAARATMGLERDRQKARAAQNQESRGASRAREELHDQQNLADTLSLVSKEAQRQVETLSQLAAAGADNAKIVERQIALYARLDAELTAQGHSSAQVNQRAKLVFGAAGTPTTTDELNTIRQSAKLREVGKSSVKGVVESTRVAAQQNGSVFGDDRVANALFGSHGFASRVLNSTGTFIVRNFSAGLVFGLSNAVQDALSQGLETESTFVRVSDALEQTGRNSDGLRTHLQGLSQDYGVALKDVYTTAAGLTGLFDESDIGNEQLLALTKVAVQLQVISGDALNATEAMKGLASITSAYGEVSPKHIADVATVIQNQLSVNIEETIEGVARLSGQTAELGINFEHAAVYVAAISKFTNQTGAGAGEQFSRILASLQTGRTQNVISKLLPDTKQLLASGDYQSAFDEILKGYRNLSEAQRDQVATALGGQRQAASVNGLLIEGGRILETVTEAQQNKNAADQRADKIAEQLQNKMARLNAAFVNFFGVLIRSGVLDAFGLGLEVVLKTMEAVNGVLSEFNNFLDSSPVLSWGRTIIMTMAGIGVAVFAATRAWRAMMAAINSARTLTGARAAASAVGDAAAQARLAVPPSIPVAPGTPRRLDANRYIPRPSSLPQTSFGTSARDAALQMHWAQRYIFDENGIPIARASDGLHGQPRPIGRFGQFVARRRIGFENLGTRLADQSVLLGQRAQTRLEVGGFANSALGRGEQALSKATGTASRSLSTLAGGVSRLSGSMVAGVGGALVLSAALGVVFSEMQRSAAWAEQVKNSFDKALGRGDFAPEEKAQGPAEADPSFRNDFEKEQRRLANQGFFSFTKEFFGAALFGKGDPASVQAERFGDLPDPTNKRINTIMQSGFRGLRAAKDTVEVQEAIAKSNEDIDKFLDEVDKSNLSTTQRANVLAQMQDIRTAIQNAGTSVNAKINGLKSIDVLTQDQLDALPGLLQSLGGLSRPTAAANSDLINRVLSEDLGFDPNSKAGGALSALAGGASSDEQRRNLQKQGLQAALDSARATLDTYKDPNSEAAKQTRSKIIGLITAYDQLLQQDLQAVVQNASAFAEHQRFIGNFDLAAMSGNGAVSALITKRDETDNPMEKAQFQNQIDQINAQAANDRVMSANASIELAKAGERNQTTLARLELDAANNQLAILQDGGSFADIQSAQQRVAQAQIALTDANHQFDMSKRAAQSARRLNPVSKAQYDQATALMELTFAQNNFGQSSVQYQQALAAYYGAQQSTQAALLSLANAQRDRVSALIAPGDEFRKAQQDLFNARARASEAAQTYGRNSEQYIRASIEVINAQRQVTAANDNINDANTNLGIAMAEAAGKTVDAARLRAEQARGALARAQARSGGARTSEVIGAEAGVVSAQAAERDAKLQDSLDTIDFNKQMGNITAAAAISQLEQLLQMKDLTEKQRRDLMLKIKGLKDEVNSQFDGQWNIGDIRLPTPYEVRRAIGLDQAQALVREVAASSGVPTSAQPSSFVSSDSQIQTLVSAIRSAGGGEQQVNITIPGADLAQVKKLLTDLLGPGVIGRTGVTYRRT